MKSLCLFASYFTSNDIPDYVKVYLKELKYQFNEVVLIGSQSPLSESSKEFLNEQSITYHFEKNEGFDFGLWYKGFQKINVQDYDQLALVNDSCVLFKPLDDFMNWAANEHSDMLGMTYSEAIAPHLQSYFLVLNKKAIAYLNEYFNTHKLVSDITNVIRTYEVGFSGFLLSKGLKLSAYMGNKGADSEFSPYYSLVKEQLAAGIPLIKKKILFTSYRKDEYLTLARMDFDIRSKTYLMLIRKYNPETIIPFEKLVAYSKNSPGIIAHVKHRVMRVLVRWYRKLKYGS